MFEDDRQYRNPSPPPDVPFDFDGFFSNYQSSITSHETFLKEEIVISDDDEEQDEIKEVENIQETSVKEEIVISDDEEESEVKESKNVQETFVKEEIVIISDSDDEEIEEGEVKESKSVKQELVENGRGFEENAEKSEVPKIKKERTEQRSDLDDSNQRESKFLPKPIEVLTSRIRKKYRRPLNFFKAYCKNCEMYGHTIKKCRYVLKHICKGSSKVKPVKVVNRVNIEIPNVFSFPHFPRCGKCKLYGHAAKYCSYSSMPVNEFLLKPIEIGNSTVSGLPKPTLQRYSCRWKRSESGRFAKSVPNRLNKPKKMSTVKLFEVLNKKYGENSGNPLAHLKLGCWKCGKPGHIMKDCDSNELETEQFLGHFAKSFPNQLNKLKKMSTVKLIEVLNKKFGENSKNTLAHLKLGCWKCGKPGHVMKDCDSNEFETGQFLGHFAKSVLSTAKLIEILNKKFGVNSGNPLAHLILGCWKCGKPGHVMKDCDSNELETEQFLGNFEKSCPDRFNKPMKMSIEKLIEVLNKKFGENSRNPLAHLKLGCWKCGKLGHVMKDCDSNELETKQPAVKSVEIVSDMDNLNKEQAAGT